jgi:glycerate kinase
MGASGRKGCRKENPRVLVVLDSFKGTLSSAEAGEALARGIQSALPMARVTVLPVADGGEGTIDAVLRVREGELRRETVADPLGRPVRAAWALLGNTAIVEMASASGLELLRPNERNPARATSRGTGELMAAAVKAGARRVVVAAGGSATVDGGAGALEALGFEFLDNSGHPLPRGGGALVRLDSVRPPATGLPAVAWEVACDVTNPLLGPCGAAPVYGPQKGADPAMVGLLSQGLARLAAVAHRVAGVTLDDLPMAGSAGGLSGGLHAFLGAVLVPGGEMVLDMVGFDEQVKGVDLVLTGEGRVDRQSLSGKILSCVARRARLRGIPCAAVAGCLGEGGVDVKDIGVATVTPLWDADASVSLADLALRTPGRLEKAGAALALEYLAK